MLSSIFRARKCNVQPGPLVDNYGIIILGMLLFRLSHSWTSIHNTIIFIIIPGEGNLSPYLHCNLLYLKIWPRIRLYPYCVTLPISCIISFSVWLSFKDTEVALNLRLDWILVLILIWWCYLSSWVPGGLQQWNWHHSWWQRWERLQEYTTMKSCPHVYWISLLLFALLWISYSRSLSIRSRSSHSRTSSIVVV
jgi:hypothetical protein